ncbi:DUF551 domain-containing protein [Yersinia intermedia]|uniref:DUF551 domain-containing protein n=1 Tax=Yersinia intermedia TaxID=631 RepID=UPI0039C6CCC3
MKDLDSFTVERLEEWINTPEKYDHRYSPRINCDELRSLARIALAVKRAEPVGYWNDACDLDDGAFSYANDAGCTRPLYTTPQLNSQVPLGSWINCIDQMPEDDQVVVIINSGHGFLYEAAVVTRRGPHFDLMDGLEASNYDGGAVVRLDMEATHWMPLPAAPEKENG